MWLNDLEYHDDPSVDVCYSRNGSVRENLRKRTSLLSASPHAKQAGWWWLHFWIRCPLRSGGRFTLVATHCREGSGVAVWRTFIVVRDLGAGKIVFLLM